MLQIWPLEKVKEKYSNKLQQYTRTYVVNILNYYVKMMTNVWSVYYVNYCLWILIDMVLHIAWRTLSSVLKYKSTLCPPICTKIDSETNHNLSMLNLFAYLITQRSPF